MRAFYCAREISGQVAAACRWYRTRQGLTVHRHIYRLPLQNVQELTHQASQEQTTDLPLLSCRTRQRHPARRVQQARPITQARPLPSQIADLPPYARSYPRQRWSSYRRYRYRNKNVPVWGVEASHILPNGQRSHTHGDARRSHLQAISAGVDQERGDHVAGHHVPAASSSCRRPRTGTSSC